MANPTVFVEVQSIGVQKTKREIRSVADEAERLEKVSRRLAQSGQRKTAQAFKETGGAARKTATETEKASRALRTFDSRLGGARRASAQFEQAQDRLNQAYDAGIINLRQYNQRLGEARKRFTTAEVKSRDLRSNFRKLSGTVNSLRSGFAGLVAGIGAFAIGRVITDSLRAADAIDKVSDTAGIATGKLQELRFAFTQSGVRAQRFDDSLRRFNRRLGEAQRGSAEFGQAFEDLGVSIRQKTGPALEATLKSLASVENESRRATAWVSAG